jgi:hypothetical protein
MFYVKWLMKDFYQVYEKQVGNFSIHFGDALQVCFCTAFFCKAKKCLGGGPRLRLGPPPRQSLGGTQAKKSGELLCSSSFLYNKEAFVANFKTFSF